MSRGLMLSFQSRLIMATASVIAISTRRSLSAGADAETLTFLALHGEAIVFADVHASA